MKLVLSVIAVASMCSANMAFAQAASAAKPAAAAKNCIAAVEKDNAAFAKALANGVKSGKIDPKEKAALEKTHAELTAAVKAAQADKNVSAEECKALGAKVAAQHKQYNAAVALAPGKPGAPAAAPAKPAAAPAAPAKPAAAPAAPAKPAAAPAAPAKPAAAPAAPAKPAAAPAAPAKPAAAAAAKPAAAAKNCIAAVEKDNAAFAKALANGVKSGKIDPKEKAALEKTHAELTAAVKAAQADKNVSAEECKALGAKVAAQHKQYNAAVALAPGKPAVAPAAPAKKQ